MKQNLITILLTAILLLTMTACSAAGVERTLDAAEDQVEHRIDAMEDSMENALRAAPTSDSGITTEEAEQIALDHAGFTRNQVTALRTEYEIDDGIRQYDVQFFEGDWEYEFEIDAQTGKILSFDKDHKFD